MNKKLLYGRIIDIIGSEVKKALNENINANKEPAIQTFNITYIDKLKECIDYVAILYHGILNELQDIDREFVLNLGNIYQIIIKMKSNKTIYINESFNSLILNIKKINENEFISIKSNNEYKKILEALNNIEKLQKISNNFILYHLKTFETEYSEFLKGFKEINSIWDKLGITYIKNLQERISLIDKYLTLGYK